MNENDRKLRIKILTTNAKLIHALISYVIKKKQFEQTSKNLIIVKFSMNIRYSPKSHWSVKPNFVKTERKNPDFLIITFVASYPSLGISMSFIVGVLANIMWRTLPLR